MSNFILFGVIFVIAEVRQNKLRMEKMEYYKNPRFCSTMSRRKDGKGVIGGMRMLSFEEVNEDSD